MLNDSDYRTYVTSVPPFVAYTMTNPVTGDSFDFAGSDNGRPIHTIATLEHAMHDGALLEEYQHHYLGLAALQMKAASGATVLWVCQRAEDSEALIALLTSYAEAIRQVVPTGTIEISTFPPPENAP